eukprot:10590514-Prorocentrum_lima.AAC.1
MTSSLVGSEMCIRDRTIAWKMHGGRPGGMGWSKKTRLVEAEGGFMQAVSYTHLTLPTICSV